MSDAPKLSASIKVVGGFRVGPNPQPANRFQLVIENLGEPVTRTAGKGANLYLKGRLGSGVDALFFDDTDARKCIRSCDEPPGWKVDWDFSGKNDGAFGLRIYTFNSPLFKKSDVLTIDFSSVVSKTAPGQAVLSFEAEVADGRQPLFIDKQTSEPDIISFYSVPAEGVQNFPGDDVQLRWRTFGLTGLELTQVGNADPLDFVSSKDEGTRTIAAVSADMQFQLRGYGGSKSPVRTLAVKVLRNGWYDLKNVILEGDPGYPSPRDEAEADALDENAQPLKKRFELEPILLLNANDRSLYALFRHEFQGAVRGLVFQTENPFAGWRFLPSSVPDEDGFVPEEYCSSPGVYFDDKIWLIGGSQIDPDDTSNGVWCFDPTRGGAWENRGGAQWRKRMGHAVLVFDNQIWVMGGRDEAGNALNDVWTLDVRNGNSEWKELPCNSPWPGRSLFSPAVFDGRIWLYGGVKEPFSGDLYDDLYVYADGTWTKKEITGIITGDNDSRKPIASSLQVFNRSLYLFGTFRTVTKKDKSEIVEQLAFRLSSPTTRTWTSVAADGLQDWGADTTFSYQSVNFRDELLIARALAFAEPNPVLKVYVPA
jgi:hypothetical protein